jgi:hypothetical protein
MGSVGRDKVGVGIVIADSRSEAKGPSKETPQAALLSLMDALE